MEKSGANQEPARKRGRPATGRVREDAIEVRVTAQERAAIEAAAVAAGKGTSVWIRDLALAAAGYKSEK